MKKLFLLLNVSFFGWTVAQKTADYTQMNRYGKKIDSIVTMEKQQMYRELDSLEKDYKKQLMTKEAFLQHKGEIAQKYTNIINKKINAEKVLLETITKERVQTSIFSPIEEKTKINKEESDSVVSKRNFPKRQTGLSISYGFLALNTSATDLTLYDKNSQMRFGNSHTIEVLYQKENQWGAATSPIFIKYGIGYRSDTYMPKRPLIFKEIENSLALKPFETGSLKRSKLRNTYLFLPIEIIYKQKQKWKLGLGFYAGVNLRSIIKVKYDDASGKFRKQKEKIDSGINPFLMGAKFSLGYRGFSLFIKKDFTPAFSSQALMPNKYPIQLGIDIASIIFEKKFY